MDKNTPYYSDHDEINIITNEELNEIESHLPTAKLVKFENLKAQLRGLQNQLKSNCMTGKLLLQQPKTTENERLIESCKKEVETQQKEVTELENEIKALKKLHPKLDDPYDFQIPDPKFGNLEKFQFQDFLQI